MEALRTPFQPDERQKEILTDAAIWQRYPGTRRLGAAIAIRRLPGNSCRVILQIPKYFGRRRKSTCCLYAKKL
jgi:hypothetical protein